MSFHRFEYSIDDFNSVANCSVATTGECTITVPYNSNYRALIVACIPENPDWEENVAVDWRCVDRAWAFATVILVPMAAVATVIGTIVTIIFCQLVKKGFFRKCDLSFTSKQVDTTNNEPVDETKSPELPPAEPSSTSEDDFKSVDPSQKADKYTLRPVTWSMLLY